MKQDNEGWKSKEAVRHYMNVVDILVPGRKDILDIMAKAVTNMVKNELTILDIGCGYGDVTAEILKYRPNTRANLIDYSTEMIALCNERFKDNSNIKAIVYDLNNGLPAVVHEEIYDACVSCFSLHHIEYENRIRLYSDVYKVLKNNSLFINGDLFKGDSIAIDEWEFDNWVKWMKSRIKECLNKEKSFEELKTTQLDSFKKMGDKPGTIWQMYNDTKQAGFRYIDCLFKVQNLGVIAATK